METLTLNDGTVLNDSSAIESDRSLFLYIYNLTLEEVFPLLTDSEKTERIIYTQGTERIFLGYTKLIALRDEGNNLTTAVMRRMSE